MIVTAPATGRESEIADTVRGPVTVPVTLAMIVLGVPSPPRRVEEESQRRQKKNHAKMRVDTEEGPMPVKSKVIVLGFPSLLRQVEEAADVRRS